MVQCVLRRSFFTKPTRPGGLVGLEYLEEESDLVYVQKIFKFTIKHGVMCRILRKR